MTRLRSLQAAAAAALVACTILGLRVAAGAGGVPTCVNYDHTQCPQPSDPQCCTLVENTEHATVACKTFCNAEGQPVSCCSWYRVPWFPTGTCCAGLPTCWDVSQATQTWNQRCVHGTENGDCNEQMNGGTCQPI
jgi:hypothetical protein